MKKQSLIVAVLVTAFAACGFMLALNLKKEVPLSANQTSGFASHDNEDPVTTKQTTTTTTMLHTTKADIMTAGQVAVQTAIFREGIEETTTVIVVEEERYETSPDEVIQSEDEFEIPKELDTNTVFYWSWFESGNNPTMFATRYSEEIAFGTFALTETPIVSQLGSFCQFAGSKYDELNELTKFSGWKFVDFQMDYLQTKEFEKSIEKLNANYPETFKKVQEEFLLEGCQNISKSINVEWIFNGTFNDATVGTVIWAISFNPFGKWSKSINEDMSDQEILDILEEHFKGLKYQSSGILHRFDMQFKIADELLYGQISGTDLTPQFYLNFMKEDVEDNNI